MLGKYRVGMTNSFKEETGKITIINCVINVTLKKRTVK